MGPHFFVYGRAAEASGRRRAAGDTREELRAEQHKRSDTQRCAKKGRKMFFRGKDWRDVCFVLQVEAEIGPQLSRPWGIGTAAKTACADCDIGWNPACGGLWPPFQLIQLIYLRYLCVGAEREKRMDVCFLLTLYI